MSRAGRQNSGYSQADRIRLAREAWDMGARGNKVIGRREGIPRSTLYLWQVEAGLRPTPARTHIPSTRMGRSESNRVPRTDATQSVKTSNSSEDAVFWSSVSDNSHAADGGPADQEEQAFNGADSWQINLKSRTVQTFDQLIAHCKVDQSLWKAEQFKVRSYQVTYVPRATREGDEKMWTRPHSTQGKGVTIQMYAVSALFARKKAVITAREEIESLLADAKTHIVRPGPLVLIKPPETGYVLELSIADHHWGKVAWPRETGGPAYDVNIATKIFHKAVESLLARSAHIKFEKIVWVIGQDALHVDNDAGTTTKGTKVDVDGRPFRTFQICRQAHCEVGDRLVRDVAPLEVIVMPGNHDNLSTLMLGDALQCWWQGHPHVTIDTDPRARKYREFGRVLLGISHGDKGKPQTWSRLMPVEEPEAWGRTRYREIHVGHRHTESAHVDEINGVKIRVLPSLAPADAWHAAQGFVGNVPSAEAFHWHKEDGLIGTTIYNHAYESLESHGHTVK